jgi:valyl-tRNA synthetase
LLYNFAWSEVFDWFLEMAKSPLRAGDSSVAATVGVVLRDLLKLFHPAIPYLTDELWEELVGEGFLAAAAWPDPPKVTIPAEFEPLRTLITGIRRFRAEHGLAPRSELEVSLVDPEGVAASWWDDQFAALASVEPVMAVAPPTEGPHTRIVAGSVQAFISLEGVVDIDAERERLAKTIADLEGVVAQGEKKLANEQYVSKAPAQVVADQRDKVAAARARLDKLQTQRAELG